MIRSAIACTSLLLSASAAWPQSPLAADQLSHVQTNVPSEARFAELLRRDLLAYFQRNGVPSATCIDFQLLRDAPTQSGIAYPKYYLWVIVVAGSQKITDGAVRVAAIEKVEFEVTTFIASSNIRLEPERVGSVFPAVLVPSIIAKAAASPGGVGTPCPRAP